MSGADCWTDHRLIISKLNIRIQPKRRSQGKKAPKRLNITKLKNINIQGVLWIHWKIVWNPPQASQDAEDDWKALRELIYNTATEIQGLATRKHKDWFDYNCDEIKQLLDEKHRLYQAYVCNPKSTLKKETCTTIRRTVQ